MSLYLTEHFYSLQGEGRYIGTPSVFIRLAGCNFQCEGFDCKLPSPLDGSTLIGCDTIRAVNKKHFGHTWTNATSGELIELYKSHNPTLDKRVHCVITGGEPTLYFDDRLYEFALWLNSNGIKTTVETNASIKIDFDKYPDYKQFAYSMSVKLSNSGEPYKKRVNPEALKAISNYSECWYKFVIDKANIEALKGEIEEIKAICDIPVYCMPSGGNMETLKSNAEATFLFCMENKFNYTDRIHIRVFNDKEGI